MSPRLADTTSPDDPPAERKVKLSVTLDSGAVHDLRRRVGSRGLSAVVNNALVHELARLEQQEALDRWLDELEVEEGPISPKLVDKWDRIWDDVEHGEA